MAVKLEYVLEGSRVEHVSKYASLRRKDRPEVRCVACDRPTILKLGNLISHHAAHKPGSDCSATGPETVAHYNAKYRLKYIIESLSASGKPWLLRRSCTRCGERVEVSIEVDGVSVDVERRLETRQPDVLLTWPDGRRLAVEVHAFNAVSDEKAADLKAAGLPWIEVSAQDCLQTKAGDKYNGTTILPVERSSEVWGHRICRGCQEVVEIRNSFRTALARLKAEGRALRVEVPCKSHWCSRLAIIDAPTDGLQLRIARPHIRFLWGEGHGASNVPARQLAEHNMSHPLRLDEGIEVECHDCARARARAIAMEEEARALEEKERQRRLREKALREAQEREKIRLMLEERRAELLPNVPRTEGASAVFVQRTMDVHGWTNGRRPYLAYWRLHFHIEVTKLQGPNFEGVLHQSDGREKHQHSLGAGRLSELVHRAHLELAELREAWRVPGSISPFIVVDIDKQWRPGGELLQAAEPPQLVEYDGRWRKPSTAKRMMQEEAEWKADLERRERALKAAAEKRARDEKRAAARQLAERRALRAPHIQATRRYIGMMQEAFDQGLPTEPGSTSLFAQASIDTFDRGRKGTGLVAGKHRARSHMALYLTRTDNGAYKGHLTGAHTEKKGEGWCPKTPLSSVRVSDVLVFTSKDAAEILDAADQAVQAWFRRVWREGDPSKRWIGVWVDDGWMPGPLGISQHRPEIVWREGKWLWSDGRAVRLLDHTLLWPNPIV